MKKALSHVTSRLVGRPQFTHPRTLPECWHPSATVRSDLQVSMLKHYTSDKSVLLIMQTDLNPHPYKLQILHSLSNQDKQVSLQFGCHFQVILTENQDLLNNLLMSNEAHFYLHGPVNKPNSRYWSAPNPHEFH